MSSLQYPPIPVLNTLLDDWRTLLSRWARTGALEQAAQQALLLPVAPQALAELSTRLGTADFSDLPPVQLLPASAMAGAAGAYARSTGLIYLNQEWLASASRDQVLAVLTEELGHHLDALLNSSDTPGDEGELFAALLTEAEPLSDERRQALLADNDQGLIWLEGRELAVERASLSSTPIPAASPGRTRGEFSNIGAFAALKSDGSVVTWGGDSGGDSSAVASQLSNGVSQIFSSMGAFAALKSNGSVVTWGNGFWGGDSNAVASQLSSGVSQIFSNSYAFAALKSDGSVVTWGSGSLGGDSTAVASQLSSGVSKIFSNAIAFAALKSDGSVVTWGESTFGGNSSAVASQLSSGVSQVFSANNAFAALKSNGSVVTWGGPTFGGNSSAVAAQLSSGVTQIFSNTSAFAALKSDGSVVTWGDSSFGGNSSAVASQLSSGVSQVFSTNNAFAALKSNGSVVTWGGSSSGGNSTAVADQLSSGVTQIFSNGAAFAALKSNGSVVTWGDSKFGGNNSAVAGQLSSGVVQIFSTGSLVGAAGAFAALKSDGSVITWGDSSSGGNSNAVASQLTSGVTQIFSNSTAFAALKSDGSVVTWGGAINGGDSSSVASQLKNVVAFANPFTDDRLSTDGFTPGPTTLSGVNLGSTTFGYAIRNGSGAPIQVTYPGGNASANNPGNGWGAVAAAAAGSGYAFYWRNSSTGQTARWDLNSSGAYTNGSLLSSSQLISEEANLGFDLNGDGFLTNSLGYALPTGNGATIQVTYPGGNASPNNPGNLWSAVAAKTSGAGYSFYWRNSSSQQVARWELNGSGVYTSGSLLTAAQLVNEEANHNIDLNGDGYISGARTISGVNLGTTRQGYALQTGTAPAIQVTYPGGNASTSNPGYGWIALAAAPSGSGYAFYWRNSGTGEYARWDLNSSGSYTSGTVLTSSQLISEEAKIDADLDGNGYILIRSSIGTSLGKTALGYVIRNDFGPPSPQIQVTYSGINASGTSPGNGWQAVAARSSGSGYTLLWRNSNTRQAVQWQLNSGGAYQSGSTLSADELIGYEYGMGDLNGDSIIGGSFTTLENKGNATLLQQLPNKAAVIRVGTDQFSVTSPFGLGTGDASSTWQMLAAETVGGQNQILWRNNPGNFLHVWTLDASWRWQSSSGNFAPSSAAALGLETNFQLDLNGNGVIG